MKILVTGFDPFGGEKINPAIESVKKLPDTISGAEIIKLEIPTVCHVSLKVIDEAIESLDEIIKEDKEEQRKYRNQLDEDYYSVQGAKTGRVVCF